MKDDDDSDVPASEDGATVMMTPDEQPHAEEDEGSAPNDAPMGDQATLLKLPDEPMPDEPLSDQATMLKLPDEPLPAPKRPARPAPKKPAPAPLDDQLAVSTIITAPKKVEPKKPPKPKGLGPQKEQASPTMKLLAVALLTVAVIVVGLFYLFGVAGRKAPAPASAPVEEAAPAAPEAKKDAPPAAEEKKAAEPAKAPPAADDKKAATPEAPKK